jgi:ribosomal protein S27E
MCCDGWNDTNAVNGECPDCGMPTVDGDAAYGCSYSPIDCETCGSALCDDSC